MQILASLEEVRHHIKNGCVATIGNFDGVHLGHQGLMAETVKQAKARNLPSVAITFDPHPEHFFSPRSTMLLLMTPRAKYETIASLGIDYIVALPFNKRLAGLSPEEFVTLVLKESLGVRHFVVGYDYAFGKGRAGNATVLAALGKQHGFTLKQLNPVTVHDKIVSSTSIRNAIIDEQLPEANLMLGRPFFIDSEVIHGKKRGSSKLGFPTANLALPATTIIPHSGTYAVKACLKTDIPETVPFPTSPPANALNGVANIGINPTFGDVPLGAEVHLLDFHRDIYHTGIRLWFLRFLREEKKFSSIPALIQQITSDISRAQQFF